MRFGDLTEREQWQLAGCLAAVAVILAANLGVGPLNTMLRLVGLNQRWNMFTTDQRDAVAVRVAHTAQDGSITYDESAMGQRPALWADKFRNWDYGLVYYDVDGRVRAAYLDYLCRRAAPEARPAMVRLQMARIPLPLYDESAVPDPFISAPHYQTIAAKACK